MAADGRRRHPREVELTNGQWIAACLNPFELYRRIKMSWKNAEGPAESLNPPALTFTVTENGHSLAFCRFCEHFIYLGLADEAFSFSEHNFNRFAAAISRHVDRRCI